MLASLVWQLQLDCIGALIFSVLFFSILIFTKNSISQFFFFTKNYTISPSHKIKLKKHYLFIQLLSQFSDSAPAMESTLAGSVPSIFIQIRCRVAFVLHTIRPTIFLSIFVLSLNLHCFFSIFSCIII